MTAKTTNYPLSELPSELQTLIWGHLDSRSQCVFRLLSTDSRIAADRRIRGVRVRDSLADVGAVVAFLRAFLERGGRPSTLHLRQGETLQPAAREAYALAVLGALRAAGVTSLRSLTLHGVELNGAVAVAVAAAAPRLEEIKCLNCVVPDDNQGLASLMALTGPSLRRLVIWGRVSSWEAAMAPVVHSAPMLEELELPQARLTRVLAAQLCRLQRLQRLSVGGIEVGGPNDPDVPLPLPPNLRHLRAVGLAFHTASDVRGLEFPPSCVCVELRSLYASFEAPRGTAEELPAVGSVLAKLRHRTKGQSFSLKHFELPPPGLAALMPDLGAMELRRLDLQSSVVTPEDLRAAAAHLATVQVLILRISFPPAALLPLRAMPSLKILQLRWDDGEGGAAWDDEAAVREVLLGLATGSAPLQFGVVLLDSAFLMPRPVRAAVGWVRGQLSEMGRDPYTFKVIPA